MRGTSKASFEAESERWEAVLAQAGDGARGLGEQLYQVSDLILGTPSLMRALTDPSRSGNARAKLAVDLLGGKADGRVVEVIADLAGQRWSAPRDLPHAIEVLAVDSVLAAAQANDRLETVEDELFRIHRLLVGERALRVALSNKDLPVERRLGLMGAVFGAQILPETRIFVERAIRALRERSIHSAFRAIGRRAAERRQRLMATVTAASALSEPQVRRLSALLERAYGRAFKVNVGVDPTLIGGLRVTVGTDVLDASTLSRLADARRRLAG